jgi:nucleotide-binding universal stress UspA family protein
MNVEISKILVPIDGSEASMNAFDYAMFLAKNIKSQLIAMHAIKPGEAYDYMEDLLIENLDTVTTSDSIVQTIKQDADRWFTDIKRKSDASGIQVRTGLVVSTKGIEQTIIDYAGREGVGLIVIGRKGKGFTERMRGSVASHVIDSSGYPVLVVK